MVKRKIICCTTVDMSINFFQGIMKGMSKEGHQVIALSSPGCYLTEYGRNHDFKIIEVPIERHISICSDLISLFKLIKTFKSESPYVVHSMTPKAGLLCMVAAWIVRVPIRIHTFTGLVWPTATGLMRFILKNADRLICKCATHIIPEGEGIKNDLQNNVTNKPMRVLGYGNIMGVDMSLWDPSRFHIIDKDNKSFLFLFTGRIVGDKGINELVWAFSQLHIVHPDVKLMLTGIYEKDIDPLLPETDKAINNNNAIEVNGPFEGDDLVRLYAQADCFVMPSYREGFPNSVLEAGAMGLPQIVTDINGSREIISHGKNGLIVPAKDKEALYEAMRLIYENKELRDKLSLNARELISSRFERSFVYKCQVDYYNEILGKNVSGLF